MAEEERVLGRLIRDLPPPRQSLAVGAQEYARVVERLAARGRSWHMLVPAAGDGLTGEPGSASRPRRLIWGLPEALPLPSAELDLAVLFHPLEFSRSPYRILAEAERVLAPGGCLVVFVFNPVSLFGLLRALRPKRKGPWEGRFRPALSVRRMLESTGLIHERSEYLFFRPPFGRAAMLRAFGFWEYLPSALPLGGVVCLQARKEEPGMTLLGPAFRQELARGRRGGLPAYPYGDCA